MSDADDLVTKALKQLEEHKKWLANELEKLPTVVGDFPMHIKAWMIAQAGQIRLRVARTDGKLVSAVYEYPDELFVFLRSEQAPKHLRDTLAGGHVVDPNQPTWSAKREVDDV